MCGWAAVPGTRGQGLGRLENKISLRCAWSGWKNSIHLPGKGGKQSRDAIQGWKRPLEPPYIEPPPPAFSLPLVKKMRGLLDL